MSIGGEEGEPAYLIPSFKGGKKLKDPIAEFKKTGEHLGGPFKTWQEAEKFGEMRHQYVEKGQDIPTPLKTWGDMQDGGTLSEKVLVHDPQDYEGGHRYALKKTITPYKTNQEIKKYTKAATNPEDIDFLHNYRHTSGVDNKNATAVPYEGDRHWNIDRFITDPAFGKDYPNLKSDDGSIEAERRNVLADMFKYQMYQHPEQSKGKSFRQAKRFVRNEIDPRVEGPYFQNYMREGVYPVNTGGLTTFTNSNPFFAAWETMQGEEDPTNKNYRKNPWDDAKVEEVAKDYLKNTKKLSRKETREQIKKWKDESKSMIDDYYKPSNTPQTGEPPIQEMAMGGALPGAVGFTYARTQDPAPSNGKYTKKTKASAQDGKALSPDANDRSTLGFNTDDPAFQNIKANSFVPFDKKDFEGIRQNMAGYMSSPLYMDRLSKSIPDAENAKEIQKRRLDNLLSIKLNPKTVNEGTNYSSNSINLGATDFVDNAMVSHEIAHGTVPNLTTSYGKQNIFGKVANVVGDLFQPYEQFSNSELEKINIPLSGEVTTPGFINMLARREEHYKPQGTKASAKTAANETYGDLTGMRQLLLDNGVTTEFGQELTPELFKKATENKRVINSPAFKRMKLRFKDEDIIKMNNEVAMNDNAAPLTQAQNGNMFPKATLTLDDPKLNTPNNFELSTAIKSGTQDPTATNLETDSFGQAYNKARKKGKTNFSYQGKKYSTKYKGTPEEQLRQTGITDAQLHDKNIIQDQFARNLTPQGYDMSNAIFALFGKNKSRREMEDAAVNNKDLNRGMYPSDEIRRRLDAGNLYSGLPQKYNTFSVSKNKPSISKNKDDIYYSMTNDKLREQLRNKLITYDLDLQEEVPVHFKKYDNSIEYIPESPNKVILKDDSGVMFNFTASLGKDDKGDYVSYYDKWDIEPTDFGKPFEIYDKIYLKDLIKGYKPYTPKKQKGGVIKDDMGQWAHPGEVTEIGSNDITMQGVDYPVLGISDTGDTQMMYPDQDYKFDGDKVTEFPMKQNGGWLDKYKAQSGKTAAPYGSLQGDLPEVVVTSSKPSKWGNMKFAPYDPSNQPTISQWNPKPGEREAMAAAEQARKDEENSLYNNKHIKALRNSAFADWRPYALAGGITALPAIGSALGLGSTSTALATPIAGVPGLTGANVINAAFAYQAAKNLPNVASSIKTAYQNPTLNNLGNAALETGLTTLDALPFASSVAPGVKAAINASKESGLLSNAYKVNPFAFKSNSDAYTQGTANASSSNYIDDFISSNRSYFEEKAGEKLAGAKNRKAIAEGNKWFEDWANNPETARKIRQQIIDQKTFGKNNPEIFDRINTPETMGHYEYLTTYKPGAAEYPLADQKKDLIKTILGKNEYRTPMIHADNTGVSYRHGLSPWTSNVTSMDYYTPGNRLSGPGTWISRTPAMNQAARKSITIHENTHDWLRDDALTRLGYKDEIQSHLSQEAMDANTKWVTSGYDTKKNYLGYLADPTEVHARIMQARQHFGLTPTDKVTSEMAESMLQVIREGKTSINKQFADIFSSPKGAAQLFNKLPVVAPVAVGVGAAATTLPKEQKNCVWLNKYK